MSEPIIIPSQTAHEGDTIESDGQKFLVQKHYAQGKDMKSAGHSYIIFNEKGAFGLALIA